MSEIEELRREVDELRGELVALRRIILWERQQREVIGRYLEILTSTREWKPWEKRLNGLFPFWGWLHPWRVLHREPFSVWANDLTDNDPDQ